MSGIERQGVASSAAPPPRVRWRAAFGLRVAILMIGVALAAILSLPGQTVTTKYVNDLFIFLDGAHRIWSGQVPNVDFHSSLGPLAFYLAAAGYGISGTVSGAMPAGMALIVILLAVLASEIIANRMRQLIGLPLALFLLLIAAVPVNPGEWIGELSFAMFYNRIGWAALGLLLVMYLPRRPEEPQRPALDALCAATLSLLMLYTKITYGLMAMAFLAFMLTDRRQRVWSAMALASIAVSTMVIEIVWQGSLSHLNDLRLAGMVSGDLPTFRVMADVVLTNLADIAVFGIVAALLLHLRRRVRDFLFVGFCLASGLLIIEQNFQIVGILTLGAAAAVIAEQLLSSQTATRGNSWAQGLPLLLGVLILPPTVSHAISLTMHAGYALSGEGEQMALPRFDGIRLIPIWSEGQYEAFRRYNASIADGAAALERLGTPAERLAVLDFVNPFSAGLNLEPPAGDSPWYHWGRTLDRDHFPDPADIFADVVIIMEPKSPIEIYTGRGMREVYADYLDQHFSEVIETAQWKIYRRR